MWQVAYRMSLFSPREGRHDDYDWTVPLKYLSHPIGLTLNQRDTPFQSKISWIMKLLKSWSAMTAQWAPLIKPDKVVLHWRAPIREAAVDLSWCYLRKRYITWGPDSPGHAWMYGADSRAGCHPSGLINEELGPVFNVFNMGRWRGRHTDGTHPSLWLMKSPAVLSHFRAHSKMRWNQFLYLIFMLHSFFLFCFVFWILGY